MIVKSPAKINLFLEILSRRPDGYHNIFSLMEKISLFDELQFEKIPSGIEVHCPAVDGPPEKNLVYKAAMLLKQKGKVSYGARLQVKKNIPMGGGLGGGSSNAATVLKVLNRLWGLDWPSTKLAELGSKLGADVPFFINDGPAHIEGIGDQITSLTNLPNLSIILINPGVSISTPWAYSAWDVRKSLTLSAVKESDTFGKGSLTPQNRSVTSRRTFAEIIQELHNDFESVVIPKYPEIQKAKEALKYAGAEGVLMSGSGSTVFGLFDRKEKRDGALQQIKIQPKWQIFAVENWGVDKR